MKQKKAKRRIRKKIYLWLINHFLCGQRFYRAKRTLLRKCGFKVGENTKIVGPLYFGTAIQLDFGKNVFLNHNLYFEGNGSVFIDDNCDIAPFVVFLTGSHEIGSEERRAGNGKILSISIGSGSWIGANSTILDSTIGNGCVIGCGSLIVDSNIESNCIVHGEKAKIIRKIKDV